MPFFVCFVYGTVYNMVWLACILSAASGSTWAGFVIACVFTLLLLLWQRNNIDALSLGKVMAVFITAGFLVDSSLSLSGFIHFASNPWPIALAPFWIIGLWIFFSSMLYVCFRSLFTYYKLFAGISLIGFPMAYGGGAMLGAATLPYGLASVGFIGITWALLFPALLFYCQPFIKDDNHAELNH